MTQENTQDHVQASDSQDLNATEFLADQAIGNRVGPYRIVRELGRGGMGAVYLGIRDDAEVRMSVSIKVVKRTAATQEAVTRFLRERQFLADLKHPYIAMLLDAGRLPDGSPYFIMEYIEGHGIYEWCMRHEPPLDELLHLFRKVIAAVCYAHGKGIVHSDIKPGNLMVSEDGEPRLLDFGIAQLTRKGKEGQAKTLLMTPEYAAPEQKAGHISEACDIYALGLLLLQLLTGSKPSKLGMRPIDAVSVLTALGRPLKLDPSKRGRAPSDSSLSIEHIQLGSEGLTFTHDSKLLASPPEFGHFTIDTDADHPTTLMSSSEDSNDSNPSSLPKLAPGPFVVNPDIPLYQAEFREPVPEALGHILRTCLEHDVRYRFSDANTLLLALDRILVTLPTTTRKQRNRNRKSFDALVWYTPWDEETAESLAAFLGRKKGIRIWRHARHGLITDDPTHSAIAALEETRVCLVCLGPGETPPWQHDIAFKDALAFRAGDILIEPVLLPGATFPKNQSELPSFLRSRPWIDFAKGFDPKDMERLAARLKHFRGHTREQPQPTGENPFPGLAAFGESDRRFFFGREFMTQRITAYLQDQPFLALLGPSGSGKSSLVHAGVIPQMRENTPWIVTINPGAHPLKALAHQLARFAPSLESPLSPDLIYKRLSASPQALHFLTLEIMAMSDHHPNKGRLLLVIDQFEEVFTQAQHHGEAETFVASLCAAMDAKDRAITTLLNMRTDFLSKCGIYPDLNKIIFEHAFQVEPMTRDERAQAISMPALLAGLQLEPGLLEQILNDINFGPSALPLMAFSLRLLHRNSQQGQLTLLAYNKIGTVKNSLSQHADRTYAHLSQTDRHTLRKIFTLCLIQPGEGAEDSKRRAPLAEVLAVGSSPEHVDALLQQWFNAGILRMIQDEYDRGTYVEVAHEAVIRQWKKVAEWMAEDRETAHKLNQLRHAAHTWHEKGRPDELLPGGYHLIQAGELINQDPRHLGHWEQAFIEAGFAKQKCREKERERRLIRLRRQRDLALIIALILLIILAATV